MEIWGMLHPKENFKSFLNHSYFLKFDCFGWSMSKDLNAWENWQHFLIIFKKWIIHVFPCNFLMNKDRCLENVASESRFQELSKPLIFFENWLNFGWDISIGRWFHTYGQGRTGLHGWDNCRTFCILRH